MRYRVSVSSFAGVEDVLVTAESRSIAVSSQRAVGRTVLSVELVDEKLPGNQSRSRRFDITLFCEQLWTLLDAGLSLTESLQALRDKDASEARRQILDALLRELQVGRTFSDALQKVDGVFPDLLIAAIRANERAANLPDALRRYAGYDASWRTLKRRIATALVYPMVLLGIGTLVIVFLVTYVLPRFASVYQDSGREMPTLSRVLVDIGSWLQANAAVVACALVALTLGIAWLARDLRMRAALLEAMQRLPLVRSQMRLFRLARWLRTLGMLHAAGIPLLRALDMAVDTFIGTERMKFESARAEVARGRKLSDALASHDVGSPLALSLIRVGERSGRLSQMLEQAARFHDEDVARWIERSTRVVEPLLMAFIGIIVGGVVITMYMPIFDLAGGLK